MPALPAHVVDASRGPPIDYRTLAEYLAALGYPLRLELLDILRFPHTLSEIRVSPQRGRAGQPAKVAARQTIQEHLDKLVETDLVRSETLRGEGRPMPRYQVNSLKLYELTEEMRRLTVLHAGRGAIGDATGTVVGGPTSEAIEGPRLVLVHGVYEGKAFRLDRTTSHEERWLIGRRRGLPVTLDYDPFVSMENTLVARDGRQFVVTDLGSKNGTAINWGPLPKHGSWTLRPGDVIGVGRSLLSFVPA